MSGGLSLILWIVDDLTAPVADGTGVRNEPASAMRAEFHVFIIDRFAYFGEIGSHFEPASAGSL